MMAYTRMTFPFTTAQVDDTVAILLHLGKGALMAKTDLKSAFRMIPVHRADWYLLGMHWRGQYYMDTCLPFGLRSAPFLFNEYATAIEWIMTHNYQLSSHHSLPRRFFHGRPSAILMLPARPRHISPGSLEARCADSHGEG